MILRITMAIVLFMITMLIHNSNINNTIATHSYCNDNNSSEYNQSPKH